MWDPEIQVALDALEESGGDSNCEPAAGSSFCPNSAHSRRNPLSPAATNLRSKGPTRGVEGWSAEILRSGPMASPLFNTSTGWRKWLHEARIEFLRTTPKSLRRNQYHNHCNDQNLDSLSTGAVPANSSGTAEKAEALSLQNLAERLPPRSTRPMSLPFDLRRIRAYELEFGAGGQRLGCKFLLDDGSLLFVGESEITSEIETLMASLGSPTEGLTQGDSITKQGT
jgi:hypothetical protein